MVYIRTVCVSTSPATHLPIAPSDELWLLCRSTSSRTLRLLGVRLPLLIPVLTLLSYSVRWTRSCPPPRSPFCSAGQVAADQRDHLDEHRILSSYHNRAGTQFRPRGGRIRKAHQVRLLSSTSSSIVAENQCRVVAINDVAFISSDEGDKAFEEAWKALDEERELVCKQTGTRFPPLPKPKVAILDVRRCSS